MAKIKVKDTEITIIDHNEQDYISLTDMVKTVTDGNKLIENWLRNKNTLEYIGIWETLNNPDFNLVEFDQIKNEAGTNRFIISGKQWIERTGAVGLIAKAGRYGGTYGHKDIALHFAMWISPELQLLIVKEFQRLKDEESKSKNLEWNYRRFLNKVNYTLHTDAIKENILPTYPPLTKAEEGYIYADEAELLNVAVFGMTSKQWRQENPQAAPALEGHNMRDLASIPQLTVMANLESVNALLIGMGQSPSTRLNTLKQMALIQLKSLMNSRYTDTIESPHTPKFRRAFDNKMVGTSSLKEEVTEEKKKKK
jgi:hypothetical protein